MSTSTKVFIYNAQGASPESANDLKELFSSEKIFLKRPDVLVGDFNFNPKGLSIPTVVVPGGSATVIGMNVKPQIEKIESVLGKDFNYVGICAGAFIGTINADLFVTSHKADLNSNGLQKPNFLFTTEEANANLGLISDYKALGAFYPNDSHIKSTPKPYMPYRVTLSLTESGEKLAQLYVAGPGFSVENEHLEKKQSTVVATYTDRDSYTFIGQKGKKDVKQFPAIIRKLPAEKQGGIFLSGTHIEACVHNSKVLNFFKSNGEKNVSLKNDDYQSFIAEQEKTKNTVESLLKNTLK